VLLGQQTEQFATGAVFQGEKEFFVVLEGVVQFDDEWMVHTDQDVTLGHYVGLLLALLDVLFFQDLHRVNLVVCLAFLLD
jgi:hypothetical protein